MQSYSCMIARSGFSLVELSIVLVILGLLTGGILSGQALIRAAEIRSVSAQTDRYIASLHSFRDKYFALPGDMANATAFWGAADPDPTTCGETVGTGTQTCNGNGNGTLNTGPERFRFWQHLSNAGLIEGTYTGVHGPNGAAHAVISTNVPPARAGQAGFAVSYTGSFTGSSTVYDGDYGHTFVIGRPTSNAGTNTPFLKPEEMWNLDIKLDDGRPAHGRARPYKASYHPNCATDDTPNADYALSETGLNCIIIVMTGV